MRQWTIDAFSADAFGGNTACVVEPMSEWPSDEWMQRLARENNAGATAYLLRGSSPFAFRLRWFTASVEVPLCGHATLAAAHALYREIGLPGESVTFATSSGTLAVRTVGDRYEMTLPAQQARQVPPPPMLAKALGVRPDEVWAGPYLVAVLNGPEEVHRVVPDLELLRSISFQYEGQGNVGVVAAMNDRSRYDVVDRFFAPGYGIDEDSATGSFHCILTPIMADKLKTDHIRFHQASPGRGAELHGMLDGDRVLLSGCAVTVVDARLRETALSGYSGSMPDKAAP